MQEEESLYKTELRNIKIGNDFFQLCCINNIDELFDNLLSKQADSPDIKDERIPYWAELWPSAIALSDYISENNIIKNKNKVFELACGLGLPGIVAGKLGADVTFTDYMEAPLNFAKKNWGLNNSQSARFQIFDWRQTDFSINADIVLASDIAYESRSFEDIIKTLKRICTVNTKIIISEPNRALAKPFIDLLSKNFDIKHSVKYVMHNNIKSTVNIFELSPPTTLTISTQLI